MNKVMLFGLIFISSMFGAVGNSVLKLASTSDNTRLSFSNLFNGANIKTISLYFVSLVFYFGGFFVWAYVLKKANLSKVYPIYIAITFVLIILFSVLFFKEKITLKILCGYLLIMFGIYFIF